ncbi:leucine-rich repeat-containing protein 51 [Biomphalaria glabrata]|nr:leucine-rich repeat-containing protein 51 [Biomphalaria glabrata]
MATIDSKLSVMPYEAKPVKKVKLNEIVPPVDFSFLHVSTLEECEKEEPRDPSPLRSIKKKTEKDVPDKSNSLCLKLNNNGLKEISKLMYIASARFKNPLNISWIDLSFNFLPNIDPVLTQFENLKILYLHGNEISDLKEINKLASCPKLTKLTLHGNAIENIKGYRFFVLAALPNLVNFDFSIVTKGDKVTAKTFKMFYNPDKPKKLKKENLS